MAEQDNRTAANGVAGPSNGDGRGGFSDCRHEQALNTHAGSAAPFAMVLLAGALEPSDLRQRLDVPALCLPMAAKETLLDLWIELVKSTPGCKWLKIVVSSKGDQKAVEQAVKSNRAHGGGVGLPVEVLVDGKMWRGPAGVLRDIVHDAELCTESPVIAAEAACVPPKSLSPLRDALTSAVGGVVGSSSLGEPAGVYVFRAGILSSISARGYHDIKEQLLPDFYARNIAVVPAQVVENVLPVRTLQSYLRAVEHTLATRPDAHSRSANASISDAAHVADGCIICDGVTIADGAIVYRSVLLPGARIGGGAVVSSSIVGGGATVEPRRLVRNEVIEGSVQDDRTNGADHGGLASRLDVRTLRRGVLRSRA
jgi:hypothetical protein